MDESYLNLYNMKRDKVNQNTYEKENIRKQNEEKK